MVFAKRVAGGVIAMKNAVLNGLSRANGKAQFMLSMGDGDDAS